MNEYMRQQQPLSRTPKSLSKQVANVFASKIIDRSLPALIKYWGIDYKQRFPDEYIISVDYNLTDEEGGYGSYEDSEDDDGNDQQVEVRGRPVVPESQNRGRVTVPETERKATVNGVKREAAVGQPHKPADSEFCEFEFVVQEALEEYEPPEDEEIIFSQESCRREYAIVSEEVRPGPDQIIVQEAVIQKPVIVGPNELSRHIMVAAEYLRRGMEALAIADDLDSDGFDDDDNNFLQLHPNVDPYMSSSDMTSGSGRIMTPDSGSGRITTPDSGSGRITTPDTDTEEVTIQEPLQISYINELRNRWVLSKTDDMIIRHLKQIKTWYDRVIASGYGGSMAHWLISEAIIDVLDCLIPREVCGPFYRYNLQVLFCQEVGFLGYEEMDEMPSMRTCQIYAKFLHQLRPFYMRSLFTIPMTFTHPAPLFVLMKNSKYLTKISINVMLSRPIFRGLRKYCKRVTEISAFAGGPFPETGLTENFMFLTFFKGMRKSEVIKCIEHRTSAKISFPYLEHLQLHFISEAHHHFIHCLQYFYPRVKTHFIQVMTDMVLSPSALNAKLTAPYFLEGKGVFSWDSIYMMAGPFRFVKDEKDAVIKEPCPRVKSLSVWNNRYDVTPKAALIREMVTRYGCSDLVIRMPFVYLDNEVNIITPYLSSIGERLRELHVLSSKSAFKASELIAGLNACRNLRAFSLDIACFWPVTGVECMGMNLLPDLKSLSLTASVLIDYDFDMFEENQKLAKFLAGLIVKAPNLLTLELLRTPGEILVSTVREVEYNTSIRTLVIDSSFILDLKSHLKEVVNQLPSLCYLFLYDIPRDTYLEIKQDFYRTGLQIAARETKLLGIEDYP